MSHALRVGVADQIGYFRAYNTDGSAKTDLTSSTTGLALSVFRVGASAVSISSLSAKAADNTAHADGAIRAVSGNLYTVDLPDAACADQVPSISVKGSYTGGVIEGPEHPMIGYNPASVAVGANTTAPDNASVTAIKTKTDNLPSDPADHSIIIAATDAILTAVGTRSAQTSIDAIQSDTNDIQTRLPAALESGRIAAVLDSAARVKLDASQPDYAPALAATALSTAVWTGAIAGRIDAAISSRSTYAGGAVASVTAAVSLDSGTVTKIDGIKAKTDNLPGSPASTSDVQVTVNSPSVTVNPTELSAGSVSAIQSGLATSTALSDVQTDVDAANNYLSALSGVFTGITSLANWLRRGFRKDAGTAGMITAQFEINTGGTGVFSGTTDSLEAIRDNQSAGGGSAPSIVTLQSVAGISPGVILGPTEPLVIGDDYLTSLGRSIRINLLDANGDPAEVVFGDKSLADAGVSIQLLLAKSGKPSTVADVVGTCTFFPAVGEIPPYLIVEFTRTETVKAIPGPYDMQAEAIWSDGKIVTFAPYGQIQFVRNIRRA